MTAQQLALGTAQFGLDYGITNTTGRPARADVQALLHSAWDGGMRVLDTAQAYGESEDVLGATVRDPWRVVTKTMPLRSASIDASQVQAVDRAFAQSLRKLGAARVDTLLVHHARDLLATGGDALYGWLRGVRDRGLATRIGVSVYDGQEIAALLDRFALDVVQLPASIADQRLAVGGSLARLKQAGIEVHVRSLFLQGVLLAPPEFGGQRFPQQARWLADFRDECARRALTPQQACFSFFKSRREFTVAVVGVANAAELTQLLGAWESAPAMDWSGWAVDNTAFTDPRLWNARS